MAFLQRALQDGQVKRWSWIVGGLCAAATVGVLCWPALYYPLGSDQATFAYGAKTILSGGMLYRDAADTKPPGIFLLYALAEWLFGAGSGSYKRLEPFLLASAIVPVFRIFNSLKWSGATYTMLLLSVWYYAGLGYWDVGQVELPAFVLALFYISGLLQESPRSRKGDFFLGIFPGCLFLLKQHFLLMLLLFVFVNMQAGDRLTWRERFRTLLPRLFVHGLGSLLPFSLIATWFIARGAGGALLEGMFVWPWLYARHANLPPEQILYHSQTLAVHLPALALILLGAFQLWQHRSNRSESVLLIAMLLLFTASVLQRKLWVYHLILFLPVLAILAGAGVHRLLTAGSGKASLLAGSALAGILLVEFAVTASNLAHPRDRNEAPANQYLSAWTRTLDFTRDKITIEEYYDGFAARFHPRNGLAPLHRPGQDLRIARMIQRHCAAGETLQIIEFRPAIYILSERHAPHRYFFWSLPSLLGRPGKRMEADMIRMSFVDNRPDCIVFGAGAHWDSPMALELNPVRFGFKAVDSILEDPENGIRMVLFRKPVD